MKKKQIVYIPIKVEDELPEIDKQVFTLNTMIPGRVMYPPKDNGENKNINRRISEIPDKCEQWYDENNFGMLYSKVNTWLKSTEAYVFTPEELKQLLSDTFDAGYDYGYDSANMDEGYSLNYKSKEEYIENFLNK